MARSKRPINTREIPPDLIIIITEGTKTEPNYFEAFPIHTKRVRTVGTGRNTLSLIQKCESIIETELDDYKKDYGFKPKANEVVVWCVFDKDSFSASNFGNAIKSADAKDYKIAYSNEAFELWYLLHFDYFNTGISRKQYITKLSNKLGSKYKKNDPDIYKTLLGRQNEAIKFAKQLMEVYNPVNPNNDNPSTTVYKLVEYLNQFVNHR